jgi:hypothetical protein
MEFYFSIKEKKNTNKIEIFIYYIFNYATSTNKHFEAYNIKCTMKRF